MWGTCQAEPVSVCSVFRTHGNHLGGSFWEHGGQPVSGLLFRPVKIVRICELCNQTITYVVLCCLESYVDRAGQPDHLWRQDSWQFICNWSSWKNNFQDPCPPSYPLPPLPASPSVAMILKITYCLSLSRDKPSCLFLKFHPTRTPQRFILIGSVLGRGIHGYKLQIQLCLWYFYANSCLVGQPSSPSQSWFSETPIPWVILIGLYRIISCFTRIAHF